MDAKIRNVAEGYNDLERHFHRLHKLCKDSGMPEMADVLQDMSSICAEMATNHFGIAENLANYTAMHSIDWNAGKSAPASGIRKRAFLPLESDGDGAFPATGLE